MRGKYGIKYQLSNSPVDRRYKTMGTAQKELQRCYKLQSDDCQRIDIVEWIGDDWHVVDTDDVLR